ncbi:bath-42 [Symbiodinium sp. KB8]|nr:bath-42 [Symbiodinium sp. KB8]
MSEASPAQADAQMEVLEATVTAEEASDVVLDFGIDSMPANSVLLRLASPVFNRMLRSGMKEAQQSIIKVDVASKEEFTIFYELLVPMAWSTDKVTKTNVDSLLAISDYYQVGMLKQACEELLLGLPPSGTRLLQAHKHGLKAQYERCMSDLAKKSTKADLEALQSYPDVFMEVTIRKQDLLNQIMEMKGEIVSCQGSVVDSVTIPDRETAFVAGRKFAPHEAKIITAALYEYHPMRIVLGRLLQALN